MREFPLNLTAGLLEEFDDTDQWPTTKYRAQLFLNGELLWESDTHEGYVGDEDDEPEWVLEKIYTHLESLLNPRDRS